MVMALVDEIYTRPFVWGVSDCCTRACDVMKVVCGIDPMQPVRGQYSSAEGAASVVRAWGGWRAMCAALADRAGLVAGVTTSGSAVGLIKGEKLGFALAVAVPRGWAASIDCGVVLVPDAIASWGVS